MLLSSFKKDSAANFLNANIRLEWSIELFDALAFMHEKNVVHRDLKPKNVFLIRNKRKQNQISLKIGDLGLSKEKSNSNFKSQVGTLHYQSPEIMRNQSYSFETDIWYKKIIYFFCLIYKKIFFFNLIKWHQTINKGQPDALYMNL